MGVVCGCNHCSTSSPGGSSSLSPRIFYQEDIGICCGVWVCAGEICSPRYYSKNHRAEPTGYLLLCLGSTCGRQCEHVCSQVPHFRFRYQTRLESARGRSGRHRRGGSRRSRFFESQRGHFDLTDTDLVFETVIWRDSISSDRSSDQWYCAERE